MIATLIKYSIRLSLLASFCAQSFFASAEIKGYPWSMSVSGGSAESDGERMGFSLQQGIEWGLGATEEWTLSPFIGLVYNRSNIPEHAWNNVTEPRYGIELFRQFDYGPINWGEVRVGIQKQKYHYHDGETAHRELDRKEAYFRLYMNGNWSN